MKVFFQCECDHGEAWTVVGEESERPGPATLCPNGHGVVAGRIDRPAFSITLTFLQRTFKSESGLQLADRYLLSLSDLDRTVSRLSRDLYSWPDVVALAASFTNLSVPEALALWDQTNP